MTVIIQRAYRKERRKNNFVCLTGKLSICEATYSSPHSLGVDYKILPAYLPTFWRGVTLTSGVKHVNGNIH